MQQNSTLRTGSTLRGGGSYACYLLFNSGNVGWDYYDRCYGQSVRPVCP